MKNQVLTFIAVLCCLSISFVSAQENVLDFYKWNANITKKATCQENTDCYNCTLSSCSWDVFNGTCEQSNHTELTMREFFVHGKKCKDNLNVCKKMGNIYDGMVLTFDSRYPGTLPAGYFCFWNIQNPNYEYLFTKVNHTGKENELINQAAYNTDNSTGELKWNYYDNEYLHTTHQNQDGIIHNSKEDRAI